MPTTQLNYISPVNVRSDSLWYIDNLFNTCIKNNANNSPCILLGILKSGESPLEKMFVAEEKNHNVIFIRNVEHESGIFRRSAYIIVRSKILFIHFATGFILRDIFDYCHVEHEQVKNVVCFFYEGLQYDNIADISSRDVNYKSKTHIFTYDKREINSSIFNILPILGLRIFNNIGYYIPDESIKNFHVMAYFSKLFGQFDKSVNFNNIEKIISSVPTIGPPKIHLNTSLEIKLNSYNELQDKKIVIAWFLCEAMFNIFYL